MSKPETIIDPMVKLEDPKDESAEAIRTLLRSQNAGSTGDLKTVSLAFDNVSVSAQANDTTYVKTLPKAVLNTFGPDQYRFIKSNLLPKAWSSSKRPGKTILSGLSGLLLPGEMLLVLGRPGSGCSTFLRTAANSTKLAVSGSIKYNDVDARGFRKTQPRETIYLPEEDRHIASLTVRQTLTFALRTSLPTKTRTESLVNELVELVAKLFGLGHTLDTPVGGAFFPGVSGGERKRVSIAEVFTTGASIQSFDNSTKGLDSSTALDFVKALRVLADIGQKTVMATLYQAGEEVYNTFDKVLVLDEGHEIFFGSTRDAMSYFKELGFLPLEGQTTAEFLNSLVDPISRKAVPGSIAESCRSARDLADAFKASTAYQSLQAAIQKQTMGGGPALPPGSSYNLMYPSQIWECLRRELQLVYQQRRIYYVKWITTIILCLSCGSVYFDISNNAQGAFTRGGIFYFALIVNGWFQFPELFDAHTNRGVLERQSSLHLYRPSSVALARFLIDIPLIAFQHVIFILPWYFLTRLQIDAGKFFFFYLTLLISTINFSNLLRLFAYYVGTLDDCFRYGGFSCTVLLLFAGFLIPAKDMRPYFGWLHWINPMYYGYENLFTNEFSGLTIACEPSNFVPNVGNNISRQYQICTVPGAVQGQSSVSGSQYAASYGYYESHHWRNIGIMIGLAIAYLVAGCIGSEIMTFASQGGNPLVFTSKHAQKIEQNHADSDGNSSNSGDLERAAVNMSSKEVELSPGGAEIVLSWKDLVVDIGEKRVLKGISGYVKRGELTVLCGASGAGKTTLLSHLSQINSSGTADGEVLFRGKPLSTNFRKVAGFAQQMDLHDGTATVREALEFSALLRQPKHYSRSEKLAYVDHVLDALSLRGIENALIGGDDDGLGVEQKRRLTLAVELAARPEILFADEPTSGLDSQGAAHIIQHLLELARHGHAIIVTVHQPSALLFANFDNLLALSSQGEQLYFGKAADVLGYFDRNGATCPPGVNPAEFVLETVGAGVNARNTEKSSDWASNWTRSPESAALYKEISVPATGQDRSHHVAGINDESIIDDKAEFNASTLTQTQHLTLRMLRNQWRNTPYVYSKIWVHILSGILVGFTFYQEGTSPQDLQNRAFSAYFILFLCNAIVNVILARYFFASLHWQFREGPSRAYGWVAFVNSCILCEMPAAVLVTVLYYVLWYFPSGLPLGGPAIYNFLMLLTYEIFQILLGLFMMALSPDLGFAGNVLVFIVCTCNWFNGLIVPYDQIQVFWRYWLYYLSPFTYFLGGMVTSVVGNVTVECNSKDLLRLDPPPGTTCGEYLGQWALDTAAQVLNAGATSACEVCKWTSGEQYLTGFHLGNGMWGGKWGYWGIFILFTFSNLFLVYFFTWATKVKHWKLFYFF